jgi:hypothetical protein
MSTTNIKITVGFRGSEREISSDFFIKIAAPKNVHTFDGFMAELIPKLESYIWGMDQAGFMLDMLLVEPSDKNNAE